MSQKVGVSDLSKLPEFVQKLLKKKGAGGVREASRVTHLSAMKISRWQEEPGYIAEIEAVAAALGTTPEKWVRGWLDSREQKRDAS